MRRGLLVLAVGLFLCAPAQAKVPTRAQATNAAWAYVHARPGRPGVTNHVRYCHRDGHARRCRVVYRHWPHDGGYTFMVDYLKVRTVDGVPRVVWSETYGAVQFPRVR